MLLVKVINKYKLFMMSFSFIDTKHLILPFQNLMVADMIVILLKTTKKNQQPKRRAATANLYDKVD